MIQLNMNWRNADTNMARKITEQEKIRRVNGYLQRIKRKDVPKYDLEEQGSYQIYSGSKGDYGSREVLEVVEGRFIEAIAYASTLDGFLGDWCSWDMPENCNHGYLKKINVPKLNLNQGLEVLLNAGNRREK